jgi:hypothetical protein
MVQYAVLIFERPTPGGQADVPPELMRARIELDQRIAEGGGRILAGMALEQVETATTIRGTLVTDGPFMETKEALAGLFVLEARDLDHALALGKMAAGVHDAVEVRPLIGFEILAAS